MWEQLVRECEAMVQHALGTGRVVPADVMARLDRAVSAPDVPKAVAAPDRRDDARGEDAAASASAMETSRFVSLAMAHAGLALAIAPATPEAVLLMADERERHPVRCEFGPLPLVRQMLGLAMFSLLVLLAVSVSAHVNNVNVSKSLLELAGFPLLMVEAFLVSAASLGACFANLQKINTVISDGTYDPRVQSTYWTRWVMGVISGIVLSQIVYDFFLGHSGNNPTDNATPTAIGQPLLALLGGYSVDFSSTEFSSARSTHSATSSVSQWTIGSTFGSGPGRRRRWHKRGWPRPRSSPNCDVLWHGNPGADEVGKRLDAAETRQDTRSGRTTGPSGADSRGE